MLGTVYRLARWLGTLELLYDRAEYSVLERQRNAGPESVLGILREIGKTFATDRYDRATSHFTSSKFMIWREEQRAMGEIARAADRQAVVGFATFAARATGADARWFATFIADLESGGADTSQRLKVVQSWLARLVRELDANKSYLDAKGRERSGCRRRRQIPRRSRSPANPPGELAAPWSAEGDAAYAGAGTAARSSSSACRKTSFVQVTLVVVAQHRWAIVPFIEH